MLNYIVYFSVIILVLYLYFIKTYPSTAGQFINDEIINGKKKKIVKSDTISNPVHMDSSLSIWMRYDDVIYRRGKKKYILTKGNQSNSLEMPSIILHPTLNKITVIADYVINSNTLHKVDKKIKIDCDIPMGKWFNLVLVTKNNELQLYLNGKLKKSMIINGYPKYNSNDLMINYEKGYDGFIRNIQYFDSTLTSDNISKLYYMGPDYDGTTSFLIFLMGTLFLPLRILGKLLRGIINLLGIDKLLGLNIKTLICDKNNDE